MSSDEPDNDATIMPDSAAEVNRSEETEHTSASSTLFAPSSDVSPAKVSQAASNISDGSETIIPVAESGSSSISQSGSDSEALGQIKQQAARRFKILRPHAQGGLGKVSVAKDLELNREVALKEIRFQYADDESARARFVLEAEVTGGLEHPSIVPVYGMGCFSDGRPYYAMRFIRGQSLKDVVDQFHQGSTTVSTASNSAASKSTTSASITSDERIVELRRLLQRFIAVCQAIEYAHSRNIIHRDIKPANIMLGDYGETLVVDWGLAKPLGQKEIAPTTHRAVESPKTDSLVPASGSSVEPTQMGSTIGTLQYMGPEQAAGRIDLIGPPADIYSLGATLYYVLTGRPSVAGETVGDVVKAVRNGDIAPPSKVLRGIPKSLDAICLKAMALKPEDRYESAQAIARDLERWMADEPVSVCRESRIDRAARWLRRNRAWFRAATLATIAIIAVLSVAIVLINGQRSVADQQRQRAENLATEKSALAARETELRKKAQWQGASRAFEQSLLQCEQQDPAAGVLSLIQNLAEAESIEAADLEYSIRAQLGRWEGALNTLDSTIMYQDSIRALQLSPDGKKMLVATNGSTTLLDLTTNQTTGEPLPHGQRVTAMLFFNDGQSFITASEDLTIRFWNTATVTQLGDSIAVTEAVVALALNSEQTVLATASGNELRLWDVKTRQMDGDALTNMGTITAIAFCNRSPLLLVSDWNSKVQTWDTTTKKVVGVPWEHGSGVLDVAVSPDGKLAATCEVSNLVRLWDISTSKQIGLPLIHSGLVTNADFSADGNRLVTGCADQQARVWDVASGAMIKSTLHHSSIVNAATFDKQGEFIWTGCSDKGLRRWRVANGRSINLPLDKNGNVVAARFDRDAKAVQAVVGAIVAGSFVLPGELRTWQLSNAARLETALINDRWLEEAAFSDEGEWFATASSDHTVQVWQTTTGEPALPEFDVASEPSAIVFSTNRSLLLVGTVAGDVHLWDLRTGKPLCPPIRLGERVSALAFFPSNDRFIVGCWDQNVRIFSVDQKAINDPVVLSHEGLVGAVGVNPKATLYFTSTSSGSIRLWDADTNKQVGVAMKHASRVKNATFSMDGATILAGYHDGTFLQWDVRTCSEIGPPYMHTKEVMALAQSRDGVWALTASADWTAKVWNIGPETASLNNVQRRFERLTNMQQLADGTLQVLMPEQWQERQ